MGNKKTNLIRIALIVALGGLLMGFDASVISGVVGFIETEFQLTKLELGWAVSSLTLTATLAMLLAGPLSDKFGRIKILTYAALLYAISAIWSALAPDFISLVIARMIGGLGVGASLILAPMYIAEISPAKMRGRLVSFNQLNIVIGISLAFFTNYLILQWAKSDANWALSLKFDAYSWRWMLGLETLPAIIYFIGLQFVPKSPRWLLLKNRKNEAIEILQQFNAKEQVEKDMVAIEQSMLSDGKKEKIKFAELFKPALTLVLTIGIVIAILQQITGINAVFFYAPMIFEQSGIGTDASFVQAILIGITNLIFTVLAIAFIDKFGRKVLLVFGVSGIAICMFLLAYGFYSATYKLTDESIQSIEQNIGKEKLTSLIGKDFDSDISFEKAVREVLGESEAIKYESELLKAATHINSTLILLGIIGFVASFAISLGPVMWVLFSELFPNRIRGLAISFVGLINSAISFMVQLVFPWELDTLGSAPTFLIYGLFAAIGLIFIIKVIPETKNKTLEQLEKDLIKSE